MASRWSKAAKRWALAFAVAAAGFGGNASAVLLDRTSSMVYDTVLDITWVRDAMKKLTALAFWLMAAFAMLTVPVAAGAAPIVFEFQGTVTSIDSVVNTTLGITTTDTLAGSYAFVPTADSAPADPALGAYEGVLTSLTVTIGGHTWTLGGGSNFIQVNDNFSGADLYRVVSFLFGPTVTGITGSFEVTLSDPTQSAFDSDALPLDPPDLAQFSTRIWSVNFDDHGVRGELTVLRRQSQVPEPPTLVLLAVALAGLGAVRWRRGKPKRAE